MRTRVGAELNIDQAGAQPAPLAERVKGAVIWRSGSQIVAQILTWASTFLVIRLLEPSDYGLYAMTQVILVLLTLLNGWGFASALVQQPRIEKEQVRQVFGLLILVNCALAAISGWR